MATFMILRKEEDFTTPDGRFFKGNSPDVADIPPPGYEYGDTIRFEYEIPISKDNVNVLNWPWPRKVEGTDPLDPFSSFQGNDIPYLRLAETYLLKAEAEYLLGNSEAAAQAVNTIRRRSNATEIAANQVNLDFILDERTRELVACGLFSSHLPAQIGKDTVTFIHLSDLHFCDLSGYHQDIAKKRDHYGSGAAPFRSFLQTVPGDVSADFIAITGDMIDFFEGETGEGQRKGAQIEQFIHLTEGSPVPLYLALGNHDIASYRIRDASYRSDQAESARARAAWIRNAPCFREGTWYSRVIRVGKKDYRLIFLDNGYYTLNRQGDEPSFAMDPYQLDWLDRQLKMSDDDVEIIFMHIPPVVAPEEELALSRNTYHIDHRDTKASDFSLDYTGSDAYRFHQILDQNASARMILTGHRHSSAIHRAQFQSGYAFSHVMTGAGRPGLLTLTRPFRQWLDGRVSIGNSRENNINCLVPT